MLTRILKIVTLYSSILVMDDKHYIMCIFQLPMNETTCTIAGKSNLLSTYLVKCHMYKLIHCVYC